MSKPKRYPLGEHHADETVSATGRPLSELTMEGIRAGQVGSADLSIHPDTLRAQAEIAQQAGFGQLAASLRRAAELASVPQAEVLAVYEALRPYRVGYDQLIALADKLEREYGAVENAALVREAAAAYKTRGLV